MTKDEALKLALEVIQDYVDEYGPHEDDSGANHALNKIKEALAQPKQEPPTFDEWTSDYARDNLHKLKAQPEQPEEEQEIEDLRTPEERRDAGQWHCPECFTFGHVHKRGRVTANKEKNT